MDDFLPFPSRDYFLMLFLLLVARGMDVLSTWVATPNLLLEGNPIAKKLGWRGVGRLGMTDWLAVVGSAVGAFALWSLRTYPAVAISIGIAINLIATAVHGRTILLRGRREDWIFWVLVLGAAASAGLTNGTFVLAQWVRWLGPAGTVLNALVMIAVIAVARHKSKHHGVRVATRLQSA